MLTKKDLKWTNLFLSIYSKLGIIPATFKPDVLGKGAGQMQSGKISIRKRITFKLAQMLLTGHSVFILFRTLEYATGGGLVGGKYGEKEEEEDEVLDWDLVPMMLIFTNSFLTMDVTTHLIFNYARQLNVKVYNEILKLRGTFKIDLI